MAVNLKEWLTEKNTKWDASSQFINEMEAEQRYFMAVESMACLNKNASALMKKYGAHGATDITGFGIKGHAQNLCDVQAKEVDMHIHKLPIIEGMDKIN